MNRRKLIGGIGLLLAAPAIVKVSNIMPISVPKPDFMTIDTNFYGILKPGDRVDVKFDSTDGEWSPSRIVRVDYRSIVIVKESDFKWSLVA